MNFIGKIVIDYVLSHVKQTSPRTNLSGKWQSFDINETGEEKLVGTLYITQYRGRIKATVNRQKTGSERKFYYKGIIISGQVVLSWHENKAENFNVGTMLLSLSSDMKTLKGYSTYLHHDSGEVVAQPKTYKKLYP
jgi:hypothetical protein